MTVATWEPTLEQVVAYIPTRPKDTFGAYQPVFNANTVPTDVQAQAVIEAATNHLGARLGSLDDLCEDQLNSRAGGLAALYAAMLIELGYYPEQVAKGNSPYPMLRELWGEELDSFLSVVQSECGEVPGGGGGDNGDLPADVPPAAWDFYKPVTDLGFETVW